MALNSQSYKYPTNAELREMVFCDGYYSGLEVKSIIMSETSIPSEIVALMHEYHSVFTTLGELKAKQLFDVIAIKTTGKFYNVVSGSNLLGDAVNDAEIIRLSLRDWKYLPKRIAHVTLPRMATPLHAPLIDLYDLRSNHD